MPDIEQVIVFRHCTRMYANLCRRYAACAAKKLAECARESRRWEENLNWQIQGCTVVASHLDNLHATVGKPLHLDCYCNMGHFLCRVERIKRFLNIHLHCIVSNVPYMVHKYSGPPELLRSEISFSRTCNIPRQWKLYRKQGAI